VEGAFLYRRPRVETLATLQRPDPRVLPASDRRRDVPSVSALAGAPLRSRPSGEFPAVVPGAAPGGKNGGGPSRTQTPAPAASPTTTPIEVPAVSPGSTATGEFPIVIPADGKRPGPLPRGAHRAPSERLADAAKLVHQGKFNEAVDTLKALHGEEPDDIAIQLTLGNVYSLMGRAEDADKVFQDVLVREPLCVEVRVYNAMALMQVGKFALARGEISKALFLEPTLALGHYLAAEVSERLGDRDGARRSYRNAISQLRFPQRPLAGFYPDIPDSPELISRAARYALAALEEEPAPAA
jgi:chemotaxis protein methyltransferase CheR